MIYTYVYATNSVVIKEEFNPVLGKWAMYPAKYHIKQLAMKR